MKQRLVRSGALLMMMSVAALSFPGCPCVGVVFFQDPALESAVRASLGMPFGCLTQAELLQVTEVEASALNIRSLQGLEFCSNLQVLNLRSNQVQSITPLTNLLNLKRLDLGDNFISNIEPLAGLTALESLDVWGDNNNVRDFSPLVANVQARGNVTNFVITLSTEWTLDTEGNLFPDFQDDYTALINAGVVVIFAEPDGSLVEL